MNVSVAQLISFAVIFILILGIAVFFVWKVTKKKANEYDPAIAERERQRIEKERKIAIEIIEVKYLDEMDQWSRMFGHR